MTHKFKQYITLSIIGAAIIFNSAAHADRAYPYMPYYDYEDLFPPTPPARPPMIVPPPFVPVIPEETPEETNKLLQDCYVRADKDPHDTVTREMCDRMYGEEEEETEDQLMPAEIDEDFNFNF